MPTFNLEIIAPQRVLYSGEVESFWGPGTEGSFQLLAGHIPFLTVLRIGEISFLENGERRYLASSGGFAEVLRTGVAVLVQTAELADEIDVERAAQARDRASERLRRREPGTDIERAEAALDRALNRLKVAARMG